MHKITKRFTAALIVMSMAFSAFTVYADDSTGAEELSFLKRTSEITSETMVLTYDAAVKRAINTNSNLKMMERSLESWRDVRGSLQTDVLIAWDGANEAPTYDYYKQAISGVSTLMRGEQTLKTQINNYQFTEKIIKDSSELMVRSYLTNIASYEMDIQMLTEVIALAEKNIANLELQQSLGVVSDNEVRTAKQDYQKSLIMLENLKILLENERKAFNDLLNYGFSTELAVEWTPKAETVTENLTGYVQDSLRDDPTIKIKESEVKEAEYTIRTSFGVMQESKIKNENNLSIAQQNLEDAKRNLEKTILTTYNNIRQMEENQKSLGLDLEKARDNYKTMLVNYDTGMVTSYQVEQVKLAILQAEIALEKNMYSYSNLIFAFERPYLLTAGA